MARFCFTADLDRDVNFAIRGETAAGSLDRGQGTAPRFSSAARGMALLADMLDDMGVPAVFFCEGRTAEVLRDQIGCLAHFEIGAHGYDHEDLSHMARPDAVEAVRHGFDAVADAVGRRPIAFRAPYMKQPREIGRFLRETGTGMSIDSSVYAAAADSRPVMLPGYVAEVPVTEGTDADGNKISAYLWPMHEGRRSPRDYARLANDVPFGGSFVLADHCWHICEGRAAGVFPEDALRQNLERTREAIQHIIDDGNRPVSITDLSRRAF